MSKRLCTIGGLVFILGVVLSHPAYAYLDPGTGSYILQMLLAAVFAAGLTVKIYWGKVKGFLVTLFRKDRNIKNNEQ